MPLAFTAAWATWLSRRRLGRWPFGERGPSLTCALSCAPGPPQETSGPADGTVAAGGPTSARIGGAESAPSPGPPGVGGPVGPRLEPPPGAPAEQVRDQARELRWACSSRASSRFWSWTRLRVSWTFVRVPVRYRRLRGRGPEA